MYPALADTYHFTYHFPLYCCAMFVTTFLKWQNNSFLLMFVIYFLNIVFIWCLFIFTFSVFEYFELLF